ncbi:hypothetical protein [Staphylococcus warneri]|uniref:hypothetical protein n=1 Tax=Staphylococcus warneri TaxID=1292 RepID=UPI000F717F5C|nr:hypothetical protein [Staphylococcus warneri]MCR1796617.1 hypothetical protein [Staphylococcus warneri]MCT2596862.1 hypothetical protein [Staphylococcus warneri]VED33694.1 Uncharacterised protein [Staphylococcus warneri]
MKIVIIILGILVILSWCYLFYIYRQNGDKSNSIKVQNIILLACLLTLLMTILGSIYVE